MKRFIEFTTVKSHSRGWFKDDMASDDAWTVRGCFLRGRLFLQKDRSLVRCQAKPRWQSEISRVRDIVS